MVSYKFPRTKKGQISRLPVQMAVYVPSTIKEKRISSSQWRARVNETVRFLNRAFGGTTRVRGIGSWEENKKTINEPVYVVESFAKVRDYTQTQLKLKRWLRIRRRKWKQYVLSFEFENDLYMVEG